MSWFCFETDLQKHRTSQTEFRKLSLWLLLLKIDSFLCELSMDDPGSKNKDFKPSQGPALQKAEEISEFQDSQHSLFQDGNNSHAKQELQRLYKSFYSWLQPEKHSKDEIIFQVVLEQFMINRHCSGRSTLKKKWESSGRNLEKFMESLSESSLKPPDLVSRRFFLPWREGPKRVRNK